mmetsp:Transcript_33007/g.77136  ORF Transcript_33007/g.77136 Transcript_33007/m.77136 type:complete len:271 (+) Transcript_33007:781-1593(+)
MEITSQHHSIVGAPIEHVQQKLPLMCEAIEVIRVPWHTEGRSGTDDPHVLPHGQHLILDRLEATVHRERIDVVEHSAQDGKDRHHGLEVRSHNRSHHGGAGEDLPRLARSFRLAEGLLHELPLHTAHHLEARVLSCFDERVCRCFKGTFQWLLRVAAHVGIGFRDRCELMAQQIDAAVSMLTKGGSFRADRNAGVQADQRCQITPLNDLCDGEVFKNAPHAQRPANRKPLNIGLRCSPRSDDVAGVIAIVILCIRRPVVVGELVIIPHSN